MPRNHRLQCQRNLDNPQEFQTELPCDCFFRSVRWDRMVLTRNLIASEFVREIVLVEIRHSVSVQYFDKLKVESIDEFCKCEENRNVCKILS